ncbi:MAG: tetratricopeptide repeat protein, partial [Gammaproteobacteria bacterium]|nr:tetratricopeptide repeat protein [Gammaproteobacteria bacterium]
MRKLLHWIACHNVLLVLLAFLVVAVVFREALFGIKESLPPENEANEHKPVVSTQAGAQKSQPEKAFKQPESIATESAVIQAETADDIQQREQYDFRPEKELPVENVAYEDLLQKARKAYWNDQLDSAKKFYLAYIEQDPSNPDGYGELGNLLSTLGELDEAAEMYRQAADLLQQQGKAEQATQLQEVLE